MIKFCLIHLLSLWMATPLEIDLGPFNVIKKVVLKKIKELLLKKC
ncbi:MAG: hypothetical protein ACLTMD_13325 [Clostridium sp.]